jgi:hypothetical protein
MPDLRTPDRLTLGQQPARIPLPPRPHQAGHRHQPYLYLREDDVLTDLLADPTFADHGQEAGEIIRLLREHKITIVCDRTTYTLSATIPTTRSPDA